MCMAQQYKLLSKYRRPGKELDQQLILERATSGNHIVVVNHNQVLFTNFLFVKIQRQEKRPSESQNSLGFCNEENLILAKKLYKMLFNYNTLLFTLQILKSSEFDLKL